MSPRTLCVSQLPHLPTQPCPRLHFEVLLAIAEYLLEMGRTSDLASFVLIHRRLSSPAQNILWGHLTVHTYNRCERIMNALQTYLSPQRRAELSSKIQTITAVLNTRPTPGEELFRGTDLIRLYALCPSLRRITLAGGRDGEPGECLYPDILDAPRIGRLASITSLTLMGPPGHLGPWFLLLIPNLEHLNLFGDIPLTHFTGAPPRSGTRLRRITWGLESPPTVGLIRWLFAYSTEETGGSINLVTPVSSSEWDDIRLYAERRGMTATLQPMAMPQGLPTGSPRISS